MENNEKALDALRKIEKVIDEVKGMFPNIKKGQIKVATKKYSDPLRTLKKVSGIIVNYDENNAEIKLESLLKFLGIIPHGEK